MPKRVGVGFLPAAESVLSRSKKPLTCAEIVREAQAKGLIQTEGKTPEKTLYALLRRAMEREGKNCKFYSPEKGTYALR